MEGGLYRGSERRAQALGREPEPVPEATGHGPGHGPWARRQGFASTGSGSARAPNPHPSRVRACCYTPPVDPALSDFAALLRANGVRLSPSEVADAVEAASLVGRRRPDRAPGRTPRHPGRSGPRTSRPSTRSSSTTSRGAARLVEGLEKGVLAALEEEGLLSGRRAGAVARALSSGSPPALSPLARAVAGGQRGAAGAAAARGCAAGRRLRRRAAAARPDSTSAGCSRRRAPGRSGTSWRGWRRRSAGEGIGAERLRLLRAGWRRRCGGSRRRRGGSRRSGRRRGRCGGARRSGSLGLGAAIRGGGCCGWRRPCGGWRSGSGPGCGAATARAGRARWRCAARSGGTSGLGGVPARLVFRPRRPHRPELVVLCDVSESVRHATRLMLLFLYTLQDPLQPGPHLRLRLRPGRGHRALRAERDPTRAADLAVAARAVHLAQNTSTGRALGDLPPRVHGGAVTRRTTVLVIGDGRNNYTPPRPGPWPSSSAAPGGCSGCAPSRGERWGTGDSDMPLYQALRPGGRGDDAGRPGRPGGGAGAGGVNGPFPRASLARPPRFA